MRPGGQMDRVITGLTVRVAQARDKRAASLLDTRTGEWEQQIHVEIGGTASTTESYRDRDIRWELPFVVRPLQRLSELEEPHFNRGVVMRSGDADFVKVDAHVQRWIISDEGWYVGARMRFSAHAPLVDSPVVFSAVCHLRFQGCASQAESDEE